MDAAHSESHNIRLRTACGLLYGLSVWPFYGGYFASAAQAFTASVVALAVALIVGWFCRRLPVWQFCLILVVVGYPMGYVTDLSPAFAALLLTAITAIASRKGAC